MTYESLLLLGVLSLVFMLPHLALGLGAGIVVPGIWMWVHLFLVTGIYFLWFWTHGGQTLAMQTWKIRLVGADGNPPTLNKLIVRYVLMWPSTLIYGIGVWWALFDRDRQFLHDRIAGTCIRSSLVNDALSTTAIRRQSGEK